MDKLREACTELQVEIREYECDKALQIKLSMGLRQIEEAVAKARSDYWAETYDMLKP